MAEAAQAPQQAPGGNPAAVIKPKQSVGKEFEITITYYVPSGACSKIEKFTKMFRMGGDGKCYMGDVVSYITMMRNDMQNKMQGKPPLLYLRGFIGSVTLESSDGAKHLINNFTDTF